MKTLSLKNTDKVTLLDDSIYEQLKDFTWHFKNNYVARSCKGEWLFMHREIMEPAESFEVDHIDRNKLNNQVVNLRVVKRSDNTHNNSSTSKTSGYRGVYLNRHGRWYSTIHKDGKYFGLGSFDNIIDAALAYDVKARELYGPHAFQNFPQNLAVLS